MNLALARKLRPALLCHTRGGARLLVGLSFHDREMRNIRPVLVAAQLPAAELIVQLPHAIGGPPYLYEHRRSGGEECFHVSQFDTEGNDATTSLFEKFQRGRFGSSQLARRKDGEMSRHVSNCGVEFLAQLFDKLANR